MSRKPLFVLFALWILLGLSFSTISQTHGLTIITSCVDLQAIKNNLNGTYQLGGHINCSDTVNWNDGAGFEPLGNSTLGFTGTLDGQGYDIYDLVIRRPNTNDVGLFGCLKPPGHISSLGLIGGIIVGQNHVGGLIGDSTGGTINHTCATSSVTGVDYVGGLGGRQTSNTFANVYATGTVSGSNYIGGLMGYTFFASITNAYATGTVSGSNDVGGLVGYHYITPLTNTYATGAVSGPSNIGGLIGYVTLVSNIKNNYWDTQTSGCSTSAGSSGVMGKTTAQLYQQATFAGWDFNNTWSINEGLDYPKLRRIIPPMWVANPISDQTIMVNQLFSMTVANNTLVDHENSLITYVATLSGSTTLPLWLTFNSFTRTFFGIPSSGAQGSYLIEVRGTNTLGNSASDIFVLTVANRAPIQNSPLLNQTLGISSTLSYAFPANTFSDQDLDSLSYHAELQDSSALPTWLLFQNTTHRFSGIPRSGAQGMMVIAVIVADGYGGSATGFFSITVTNRAPLVQNILSTLTFTNGQDFQWIIPANTFADPDSDPLTLMINATGGAPLPNWLAFVTTTATLIGTPNQRGTYTFQVTASDGFGGQATTPLTLIVPNTAPVMANPFPNRDVPLNAPFTFQVLNNTFFDLDQDTLIYAAQLSDGSALPTWLSLTLTGIFSGTTTVRESYMIQLSANDGHGGSTSLTFVLRVANQAPIVTGSIANQTVWIDQLFLLTVSNNLFFDPDNDTLTYQAHLSNGDALPTWLNFTAQTQTFSGTPRSGAQGTMIIAVIANDGFGGQTQTTFAIQIPNRSPIVATPILTQRFLVGQPFAWTVPRTTFNDPDQDPLQLAIPNLLAGLQFDTNNQTLSGQLATNQPPFMLQITANDGFGGTVSTTFNITINHAPQLNGFIANQAANVGNPFLFTFTPDLFTDPDGDLLSYQAQQTNGAILPIWLALDSQTRTFMGIPKAADLGFVFVELQALDPFGGRAYGTFGIAISDLSSNQPPIVAVAIPTQNAQTAVFFSFQFPEGTFVDPNGDPLTYSAYLEGGLSLPAWLTFISALQTFQGTPNKPETLRISITASDGRGGLALTTFTLVIADSTNYPPYVLNPIQQQVADVGQLFKFIIPADTFTDPNNDELTLAVSQSGGQLPHWLQYDASLKTLSGRPSSSDTGVFSDARYPLEVTASDGKGSAVASFDISVRGESTVEIVVKVLGIVGSIVGFLFTAYRNRAWLWNHTAKRWYELPPQYTIIDQDYEWTATLPKTTQGKRIQIIKVYQDGHEIAGTTGLPDWMAYKNKIHQISGKPSTDDIAELDVRVYGYDGRILASFPLAVVKNEQAGKAFVTRMTSSTMFGNSLGKDVGIFFCFKRAEIAENTNKRDIEMPLINQHENE